MRLMLLLCCAIALASQAAVALGDTESLPSSDEVVRKVIERGKWAKQHNFERRYAYIKSTRADELDPMGRVVRRSSKAEQVIPSVTGLSRLKFDVGTRQLSEEEVDAIAKGQPQQPPSRRREKKRSSMRIELTGELINRFDFTVQRREYIGRRPVLVLQFVPKSGPLPVHRIQDRLVNRAAGTIWVDEQESEVVKADIHLSEPIAITGGIVGAVEAFRYFMERTRVDDGVWLVKQTELFIRGRKFFTPVHTRKLENWSNFIRVVEDERNTSPADSEVSESGRDAN